MRCGRQSDHDARSPPHILPSPGPAAPAATLAKQRSASAHNYLIRHAHFRFVSLGSFFFSEGGPQVGLPRRIITDIRVAHDQGVEECRAGRREAEWMSRSRPGCWVRCPRARRGSRPSSPVGRSTLADRCAGSRRRRRVKGDRPLPRCSASGLFSRRCRQRPGGRYASRSRRMGGGMSRRRQPFTRLGRAGS